MTRNVVGSKDKVVFNLPKIKKNKPQVSPSAFRLEPDGLSTREFKFIPSDMQDRARLPFTIVYDEIGGQLRGSVVLPPELADGIAEYTPQTRGHWNLLWPGAPGPNEQEVKKRISGYARRHFGLDP
jgi:hypothetical protein